MQGKDALLLDGLDWHETHVRSADCLTDRFSIGCIGLVPLDVGLHILRGDQLHGVAEAGQFTAPMMSARACLNANQTSRLLCKKDQQLAPPKPTPQHGATHLIYPVYLENRLSDIKADRNGRHDLSPFGLLDLTNAPTTGAVHAIKWAVQRARYMSLETIAPLSDNPTVSLPAIAA